MLKDFKTLQVTDTNKGAIVEVQLNRPETGNSVDGQMLSELLLLLRHLEDDATVRVMVLSGAGDHFCQGGDRSEFPELLERDPSGSELTALGYTAQRVCSTLAQMKLVTIARLHGDVIGAGLGLAIFCDLRIGADTARFRMPEVGLGVPPAWGGVLPRLLEEAGQSRVRRFLLTADAFDADMAERMSILDKVVPASELDAAVNHWAKKIARRDQTAMRITKTMLNARAGASQLAVGSYFDEELLTASIARRVLPRG
ncbi:enoyl-CoA hydratase/isomerase family protein [Streptomyces sp. Isolate_45]|uniref:enoyl-CoA hydratase/isomerase family protein n=1 Tax=Streptomyces sp. Isolate_45 TaxID=2950111 RepID=UPI002481FAEA|nr:enoyl-CoA hydratase/isomerase family protein [Streptomyces sp. Isolate_45]MDA5279246.1 enoyl-CoA hydratase/isomerase family protein [Streptomyces sp. Isolate_45]